ncbi:MAG: hypothetical protein AAFX05_06120, partial [Planctomycetota bacterium]
STAALIATVWPRTSATSVWPFAAVEDAPERLTLRLSDALVDLDQPVRITVNDRVVFEGRAMRTAGAIASSLDERFDPRTVATALLEVDLR